MMRLFKKKKPTPEELEQFGLFVVNQPWKVILIMICVTMFTGISFLLIFNS